MVLLQVNGTSTESRAISRYGYRPSVPCDLRLSAFSRNHEVRIGVSNINAYTYTKRTKKRFPKKSPKKVFTSEDKGEKTQAWSQTVPASVPPGGPPLGPTSHTRCLRLPRTSRVSLQRARLTRRRALSGTSAYGRRTSLARTSVLWIRY